MGGFAENVKRQFAREGIELKEDELAVIDALEVLEGYVNYNPQPKGDLDPIVGTMRCMHKTLFACLIRYVVKATQTMVTTDDLGNITWIDGRLPRSFVEWCMNDGCVPFI